MLAVVLIFVTLGYASAAKVKTEKIKFNKKMLKNIELIDAGLKDTPFSVLREKVTI